MTSKQRSALMHLIHVVNVAHHASSSADRVAGQRSTYDAATALAVAFGWNPAGPGARGFERIK